jgi:hypothetical protein
MCNTTQKINKRRAITKMGTQGGTHVERGTKKAPKSEQEKELGRGK